MCLFDRAMLILALLVAFCVGYEMGQWAMLRRIKNVISQMTEGLSKATSIIKTHKEERP